MACCSRLCLAAVALLLAAAAVAGDNSSFEITIPDGYKVKGLDAYVCTTLELPNKPAKLVGVEPLAKQEVVHHILLFGERAGAMATARRQQAAAAAAAAAQQPRTQLECMPQQCCVLSAASCVRTGCDVPYSKPKPGGQSVWDCKSTPTCGGFSETIM